MTANLRLQQFVLLFVVLSWLMWFLATCLYIPYVVMLSPHDLSDPVDPEAHKVPRDDFFASRISAVVIVFGLCVDSLMLAGIYEMFNVKTDMMWPWFFFYLALIPGLLVVAVHVVVYADASYKLAAVAPCALALVYALVFFGAVKLYKGSEQKSANVIKEIQRLGLEPITKKLTHHEDGNE